jgi:hypothetical protein
VAHGVLASGLSRPGTLSVMVQALIIQRLSWENGGCHHYPYSVAPNIKFMCGNTGFAQSDEYFINSIRLLPSGSIDSYQDCHEMLIQKKDKIHCF